jgi:hypothetical protein
MGRCTHHTAGVKVQASRDRHAEITSGTTLFQQGLAATCKDPLYKASRKQCEEDGGAHEPVGAMKEG